MADYGVPPLNGPACQGRSQNNAYGFGDDPHHLRHRRLRGADRPQDHRGHAHPQPDAVQRRDHRCARNRAAEHRPHRQRCVRRRNPKPAPRAVPLPLVSALPIDQLWVRQQSHDRVINDRSLFNLTELSTKFRHRLDQAFAAGRPRTGPRHVPQPGLLPQRHLRPVGPEPRPRHQRLRVLHAARQPDRDRFARQRAQPARQPGDGDRRYRRCLRQRHHRTQPAMEAGRGRAPGPLQGQCGEHGHLGHHARLRTADRGLHQRARRRHLAAHARAVVLRVVQHPRSTRRSNSWSRPPGGTQPLPPQKTSRTKPAASGT